MPRKRLIKSIKARRFALRSRIILRNGIRAMGQEAKETEAMAKSFFGMLENKLNLNERKTPPTEEEVKAAFEQLTDIGRFSVFTTISIIPGGGFSLIGLEMLAKRMGVKNFTFIPSSFRKKPKRQTK